MDGFPTLPLEISRQILVDAVKTRGIKRAARLRYVSRSWNCEVVDAICRSGVLDGDKRLPSSPFWPKYCTVKIMHRGSPLSRPLQIIRQVAERVLASSGESLVRSPGEDDRLGRCVLEICQFSKLNRCASSPRKWLEMPEATQNVEDSDEDFRGALFATAAWMNDIALVEELLGSMQAQPWLIAQDGDHDFESLIGWAIDTAAYRGHVEIVRLLLSTIKVPWNLESARDNAIEYAGKGNQLEVLDLYLQPMYNSHDPTLIDVIFDTTSIEIFDRVLPLCIDYSIDDRYKLQHPHPESLRTELLARCFAHAVGRGDLCKMRHLVQNYGVVTAHFGGDKKYGLHHYTGLVLDAVKRGHTAALVFLLDNRASLHPKSLDAAIRHGNTDCVRRLYEYGAADGSHHGKSFVEALQRENDAMIELLLELRIANFEGNIAEGAVTMT